MKLRDMGIKKQFFLLITAGIIVGMVLFVFSFTQTKKVFETTNYANTNSIPSLIAIDKIARQFKLARTHVWQYLDDESRTHREKVRQELRASREQMQKHLKEYEPLIADEKERTIFKTLQKELVTVSNVQDHAIKLVTDGHVKEAQALLFSLDTQNELESSSKSIDKLIDYNVELAQKAAKNAQEVQKNTALVEFLIGLSGIAFLSFFSLITIRNIMRQLGAEPKEVVEIFEKLSAGNTDINVHVEAGDTSSLLFNIKNMAEQLRMIIADLNDKTNKLSDGDFGAQIKVDYFGDFSGIKQAVNNLGKNLNNLVEDSNTINEQAQKGVFDVQIDVLKYQGDFNKISSGINGFVSKAEEARIAHERGNYISKGVAQINTIIGTNATVESLATSAMNFVARYSDSGVGGLYIAKNEKKKISLVSSYAQKVQTPFAQVFDYGDGIVGQVAMEGKTIVLHNLAQGQRLISSASLSMTPNMLIAFPLIYKGELIAVLELATHTAYDDMVLAFFEEISLPLSGALKNAIDSDKNRVLLAEIESQNTKLLNQQRELEQQTSELEMTQNELAEQNTVLEEAWLRADKNLLELKEANRYKTQFFANMSHELRTPLNAILLLSQMLGKNKKNNLEADQVKQLSIINSSGSDLLNLINDILDFSKIEAKKMDLTIEKVSIENLIYPIEDLFKPLCEDKQISFKVYLDPSIPESIISDKQKIKQILKNFLANAIKFTPALGEVTLHVGFDAKDETTPLYIDVIDTGVGIESEKLEEVFEAFKQEDGTISRAFGGTGLGLSISKELAGLLGGRISLQSKKGKGSTFTLHLPKSIDQTADEVEDSDVLEVLQKEKTPVIEKKLTGSADLILIVEDDETYSKMLFNKVIELGYKPLIASCGADAVPMAIHYQPIVILLDIRLPDIDGWEVLRLLKEEARTRTIPVKILSVNEPDLQAKRLGAVNFIQKPNNFDEVEESIKNLINFSKTSMKRILLVDDDPLQREHITSIFQADNIEVTAVEKAVDGIDAIMMKNFDCAIIDFNLPGMNGLSLLKYLAQQGSQIPIIIYTARELSREEIRSINRYEATIILKTANSYERLIEEVSIYIHREREEFGKKAKKLFSANKDSSLNGKSVLIVDDDFRNIYSLSVILEQEGVIVYTADNGQEALDLLNKISSIDLVLTDVMMPVMDGYELIKEIRNSADFSNLPIICLTAKTDKEDRETALHVGANDYLSKPINHDTLMQLIKLWIDHSQCTLS